MAARTFDVEGVGPVDFPDTMNDDQISAAMKHLYDQAHVPGMEKLGMLPGMPKQPVAEKMRAEADWLSGGAQADLAKTLENTPAGGAVVGTGQLFGKDSTGRERAAGAHKIFQGVMATASPALPLAIAASPAPVLGALARGAVGGAGTTGALNLLGVPDEYSDVAGDAMSLLAGAYGNKLPIERLRSPIESIGKPRLPESPLENAPWIVRKAAEKVVPGLDAGYGAIRQGSRIRWQSPLKSKAEAYPWLAEEGGAPARGLDTEPFEPPEWSIGNTKGSGDAWQYGLLGSKPAVPPLKSNLLAEEAPPKYESRLPEGSIQMDEPPPPPPKSEDTITVPKGSAVPANARTFKHSAEHTDLMRQIHANAQSLELPGSPAGKNGHGALKTAAGKLYGAKSLADLSYEQLLNLNERLLKERLTGLLD